MINNQHQQQNAVGGVKSNGERHVFRCKRGIVKKMEGWGS